MCVAPAAPSREQVATRERSRRTFNKFAWRRAWSWPASTAGSLATATVSLDDGGSFGLNVDEATALRATATKLGLSTDRVRFYQGADEVGAVLLARATVAATRASPTPPPP